MRRSAGTARRAPQAAARALALAAVLATSGVVAGTASASGGRAGGQTAGVQLAYTCRSAAGREHAAAQITVHYPATDPVGKPIAPGTAQVALTLPPAALSTRPGHHHRITVTGAAVFGIDISAGGKSERATWPGLAIPATRLPARGTVTLTATGAVPPIAPTATGPVTFTAAGLMVAIKPHSAARIVQPGPNNPSPSATPSPPHAPASIHLACTPVPGQNVILATVAVTGKTTNRTVHHAAVSPKCPKLPPGGLKLNPRFPPPKPPPHSTVGSAPAQGCAFTTGYADVRKLKGAALIQPGLTNVDLFVRTVTNFSPKVDYAEFDNAAQLDFHGKREFPPSTATFLTFGFTPTTATIQLIEHGTINIVAVGPAGVQNPCHPNQFRTCNTIATVNSRLSIRILPNSVMVNGVPLNVGPHCQTAPFDAVLTGSDASIPPYIVTTGGPLTGFVNVPPFKGCGVGENLDPLFNAAISGPRNFNLLTQGAVCFVLGGGVCDPKTGRPVPPTPLRKVSG